jgi:Gpi18-like mannosyltransferase
MFLIRAFVVWKLVVASLLLAAFILIPAHVNLGNIPARANLWNRYYTGEARDALYTPFCNWDGQHYLLLADRGYASPAARYSVGFYPLFPLSISLTKAVLFSPYLSALVNVTIFSFLFLWVYYAYARRFLPVDSARLAVILLLLYPSSLFLTVVYSESLFLLCLFAFLWFYDRKHLAAAAFAMLLPMIRGQGVFVACAIFAYLAWQISGGGSKPHARYQLKVLAGFTAGIALYFLFYKLVLGNAWAGIEAQKYNASNNDFRRILDVSGFIGHLWHPSSRWFIYNNGRVDKIFVLVMLAGIPVVLRSRVPLHAFLYAILVYFPAAMGVGSMSFARYSLMAVPFLIISLLQLCHSRYARWILFACIGTAFLVVQLVFVVRFALNVWVG